MNIRRHIAPLALLALLCAAGISCSGFSGSGQKQQGNHPPFTLALPPKVPTAATSNTLSLEAASKDAWAVTQDPMAPPETDQPKLAMSGTAYWYGPGWHGKPTACGEVFDSEAMTAAHPFLPFGTMVLIRNLSNEREATIRITDRCGTKPSIDVSEAAAKALGFHHAGTAKVLMTVIQWPDNYNASELIASLDAKEGAIVSQNKVSIQHPDESNLSRKIADAGLKTWLADAARKPLSEVRSKTRRIHSERTKTFFAASSKESDSAAQTGKSSANIHSTR